MISMTAPVTWITIVDISSARNTLSIVMIAGLVRKYRISRVLIINIFVFIFWMIKGVSKAFFFELLSNQ